MIRTKRVLDGAVFLGCLAAATRCRQAATRRTAMVSRSGSASGSGGHVLVRDRDESGPALAGDFHLGGRLRPDLTVGYHGAGATGFPARLGVYTLGATYYPTNNGVFVRGGIGLGLASEQILQLSNKPSLHDDRRIAATTAGFGDRNGLGFLTAFGYEWRLTRQFALGPQVSFIYVNPGPDRIHTYSVFYATELNWYW